MPIEYRFEGSEVYIRRDEATGDVVLSRRPESWIDFFRLGASTQVPIDFMTQADRKQGTIMNVMLKTGQAWQARHTAQT